MFVPIILKPFHSAYSALHWKRPDASHQVFFWWGKVDSNHRSETQQIYSLSPLATREFPHIHFSVRGVCMEPVDGLEPPTYWLQISCSTDWAIPAAQTVHAYYSMTTAFVKHNFRKNRKNLRMKEKSLENEDFCGNPRGSGFLFSTLLHPLSRNPAFLWYVHSYYTVTSAV